MEGKVPFMGQGALSMQGGAPFMKGGAPLAEEGALPGDGKVSLANILHKNPPKIGLRPQRKGSADKSWLP